KVVVEKEGRKLIFDDVLIRVSEKFALEFHVDTDEANAAMLKTGDYVYIVEEL
ncbi:MAG: PduL/EutD family phosphate acyltransferase, partial [Fervidobacterium sp.]